MSDSKGAPAEHQKYRKFTAILENGKTVVMIAMEPMTKKEAGLVIRQKFNQGGRITK